MMLAEDLYPTDDPLVRQDKNRCRYTERSCEGCDNLTWMTKPQRFCSHSCATRSQDRDQHRGNSPCWTGDAVGYHGQHERVYVTRGKADHCIHRNAIGCTSMTFNWAWIHGEDRNDIYSYVSLCKACHNVYDKIGLGSWREADRDNRPGMSETPLYR